MHEVMIYNSKSFLGVASCTSSLCISQLGTFYHIRCFGDNLLQVPFLAQLQTGASNLHIRPSWVKELDP